MTLFTENIVLQCKCTWIRFILLFSCTLSTRLCVCVCVLQNTPVGRSVFMVNATDPDQGTGGSVLFSFQPPSPFFSIDGARGTVTVIRPLDYETTSAYQLTVNATVSTHITGFLLSPLAQAQHRWMHMLILNLYLCFYQDQDKLRPLSRLANLAISITDVQDMDPIFTNLPYSTNIEEDVPLVSTAAPPDITLLISYSRSFYVKPCSISFPPILLCCQHLPLIFRPSSFRPMFNLLFDYSGGVWSRCKRNMIKTEAWVIIRAGCLTSHPQSWAPLPPGPPAPRIPHTHPNSAPGPYIQHCRCWRL